MLEVYDAGRRVINVDESWVPVADFHRRRWRRRGMGNSAPEKAFRQKVNIITAISSDGEVWIALTTCNTDTDVLMLFMTYLANVLTKEAENWRDNTIFLLDGVSAHSALHDPIVHAGLLPQERRVPGVLLASRPPDRPQRPLQLRGRPSGALVRSPQAGRPQSPRNRHRQAVSLPSSLTCAVLSRTSSPSCTPRSKKSGKPPASPASPTACSASSSTSCSSHCETASLSPSSLPINSLITSSSFPLLLSVLMELVTHLNPYSWVSTMGLTPSNVATPFLLIMKAWLPTTSSSRSRTITLSAT